jgi:hypothetical protein
MWAWLAIGWFFGLISVGMLIALADNWAPDDEQHGKRSGWKRPKPERIERDRFW